MDTKKRFGEVEGISRIAWIFSAYPLLLLFCVLTTWARAWLLLGHPPHIGQIDPSNISRVVSVIRDAGMILLLGFYVVVIPGLLFAIVEMVQRLLHKKKSALAMLIPTLLWSSTIFFVRYDPGEIIEWFFD
jgi:hypothetical protein